MKNPNFLSRITALTRLCGNSPILLLCLLLGASNISLAKGNGDPGNPKMAPDHLIVKFKEGVATAVSSTGDAVAFGNKDIDKLLHDYHCVSASKLNAGKNSAHNGITYVLKFAGAVPVERLIGSFKETGLIKYAEPDYLAGWESTTPNDPYFIYSWGLFNNGSFAYSSPVVTGADMDMKLAWDITQGSSAVTVAVIDAGVKLDHPEFAGRIWQNPGETPGNGIDDDGNGYVDDFQGWNFVSSTNDPTDDNSHGTNVTGIIGATGNNGIGYAGVDWNCKLMILKTQNNVGEGMYSDMILAINYASEKGAKVINMSIGGYASSVALQDAVDDAYANNVTIVAAMGNDNISTPLYPAACTHVVAVGATTAADTRASFSNFGSHICVAAPGNAIFGLWYLSNTDYSHGMSGTSMASPHVAGLVSLLLAQDPTRTPDQIRTILETTSEDQVGDPGEDVAGFDHYFGYGRVNAYSALTACSAPVVGAISGAASVCAGSTAAYTDTTVSGVWSSSNLSVATIGTTGVLAAISEGITVVTYTKTTVCGTSFATKVVTVNPSSAGTISGGSSVATGSSMTLSSTVAGGAWSSTNTGVATINTTTGELSGITAGTTTISYALTNSCGSFAASIVVTVTDSVTVPPSYESITTIAGNGTAGFAGDGGLAFSSVINSPGAVIKDNAGNIYFCDYGNGRVRKIDVYGNITTVAGGGALTSFDSEGGMATNAALYGLAGLAVDAAGNLYLSDVGESNVYKVDGAGIITRYAGVSIFESGGDGGQATDTKIWNPYGLAIDPAGYLYVAEQGGSKIRKIDMTTGIISTVAGDGTMGYSGDGGAATAATLSYPNFIYFHTDGNLYVTDNGNHRIRKINASGIITTVVGNGVGGFSGDEGPATAAQLLYPGGFKIDDAGNFFICDNENYRVRMVTTDGTIHTVAGTGTGMFNGDCQNPLAANLNKPIDLAFDADNNLLIADVLNNRLRKLTDVPSSTVYGSTDICIGSIATYTASATGGTWSTSNAAVATVNSVTGVATALSAGTCNILYVSPTSCDGQLTITVNGTPTLSAITGTLSVAPGGYTSLVCTPAGGTWSSTNTTVATINSASGILNGLAMGTTTVSYVLTNSCGATAATTNVTVTDSVAVPPSYESITTIAGNGTAGFSGDGGPATAATINAPNSVITDNAGNIYFTEYGNERVRKIDAAGNITTLAGNGISGFSGDGGPATNARFSSVAGLALDAAGNLYITDLNNNRVRKVSTSGIVTTYAGTGAATSGGDGGQASATAIYKPYGIAIDPAGYMYVVEQYGHKVRKINMATGIITRAAGTGTLGFIGDGGAATSANLCYPNCIYYHPDGTLYLSDNGNQRIRKISTTGIITTIAGNGSAGYSGDGGAATAAKLRFPAGLKVDLGGNVYIADFENSVVRKINTSGIISTIAGTGTSEYNGDCLAPTAAGINKAADIAFDASNNLIIADLNNNRLRKLTDLPNSSIAGPTGLCVGSNATYTATATDGTWVSSNSSVATINSATGVATALATGTCTIFYVTPTACDAQLTFTVNNVPTLSAISGTLSLTPGTTTTLVCTPAGGTWSSTNTAVATINAATGVVNGIAAGTASISYALSNGCGTSTASTTVTVSCVLSVPNTITTVLGTGTTGDGGSGGMGTSTDINGPWGMAADASGNVYVADFKNNKIRKITPSGITTVVAGTGTAGFSGDLGPATAAKINRPTGVAILGSDLYFVDLNNSRIRKINAAGIISTIAGNGVAGFSGDGGAATLAKINSPNGLCIDNSGNIYIPDQYNFRVRKITPGGIISTIAGTGAAGSGGDNGPATLAQLHQPNWVTTDVAGNVFVSDYAAQKIRKINVTTGIITTYAGNGLPGYLGDGGPATGAKLRGPGGMFFDAEGNFYISDADNHVIRKVSAETGYISTYAGTGASGFSGDGGSPATATFNRPINAITDAFGNVFISDYVNNRVRKIGNSSGEISGPDAVCQGSDITLVIGATGGTWSSSNTAVATVGSTTGIVTGISSGTTVISYTVGSCSLTHIVTVSSGAGTISGASSICVGSVTTLTTTGGAGTWSSSNVAIATIGSGTGIMAGISNGVATITYSTGSCYATISITVYALPSSIGGTLAICQGGTSALTCTPLGGTWSSETPSVAIVDPSTGIVTAIDAGSAIIYYTNSGGCVSQATVTVDAATPNTGTATLCLSQPARAYLLSNTVEGGTWSSSNVAVATINMLTGGMSGIALGTANISYHQPGGCVSVSVATVNAAIPSITGATGVCPGGQATVLNAAEGGTWSSSDPAKAEIDASTGIITGHVTGSAIVTYMTSPGCYNTSTVYIHNLPGAITGNASVCQGLTSTLSCVPAGGTWSSGSPTVCTINSTYAIASALSAGTANITYTVGSTGCQSTRVFSVNALPGAVTGTASACVGATTTLNCTPSGGTWSSSNTTRASVDITSGVVTGNTPGTGTITYTATGGCYITKSVTILPTPTTLAGPSGVCIGTYVVLTTSPAGGTWTSTNTAAASVNTGIIYGLTTGTTTISYVVANGCFQTKEITVNNAPGSITGTLTMCAGNTETLTCSPAGGNWSSSSTTIATVNAATGDVTGLTAGTAVITYSIGTCYQTTIVTINGLPGALTGTQTICEGTTTTFSGTPDGGVWSSSNDAIASVSAGIVRGNSPGVATIQYEVGAGCSVTRSVTVSPAPGSISGATSLCTGSSTTLSATPGGGVWSSSLVANATVNAATGDVAGIAAGTSEITYLIGTCYQTTVVTIIEIPDALTGVQTVCNGSTTTFGSTTVGGVWSSSNDAIASVNAGIVTGNSPGEATIQYTVGGGCSVTRTVTVIAAPGVITGATSFCIGSVSTLLAAPGGGVWSSSNTARASVNAGTGEVTAITSGTATITYTIGSCFSTADITVGSSSATIYGTPTVCEGLTTTLIGSPVGGAWSSMNTAIASVDAGVVRGVSGGVATLVYVPASGCSVTIDFTVIATPTAITGSPSVCIGATTSLNSTPAGGVWTSNVPGRASIDPASGLVTGIVAGTSRITYDISGCKTGIQITVNSSPSAISGTTFICADNSTNLSATPAGGTWLSGTTSVATVSATGTVTGLLPGTTEIEYTAGTGCSRTTVVTVNAGLPANVGTPVICLGQPLTVELLTNPVGGGTWATSNHTKLVTSTSGQMRGMSVGTVNVTYKVSTGCYSVSEVTVNPAVAPITGTTNVCPGDTVTVSNVDGGGTWSSSVVARATIDEITGSLAGISSGVSYITYKITEGCYKTRPQTVLTAPGPISGATSVVNGSTINMTCSPPYGLWSAVNAAVASVNAYSGIVRGNSVGVGRIVYTTSNGCTSSIDITVLSSKPGSSSVSETDVIFNLYPNPSSGSINVISSETGVFSVLSIDGKSVQNYVIDKSSTTIKLPYDLAAGVYMFRFKGTDGSSKMGRLVYQP